MFYGSFSRCDCGISWSNSLTFCFTESNYLFHMLANYIWATTWYFQQCGMCDQQRLKPACAYAQTDQSLCRSLEYSTRVKLLTEHHLEFLSLTGGCAGSSESTHVKMPHCWKSHVVANLCVSAVAVIVILCSYKWNAFFMWMKTVLTLISLSGSTQVCRKRTIKRWIQFLECS